MKTKFNQRKIKLAIASAIVAGSMGLSATSYAATETGTMAVRTLVAMSCSMTVSELVFPSYDTSAVTHNLGSGTITSTCTLGGSATITIGEGSNANEESNPATPKRQMANGSSMLEYDLYTDLLYANLWGNTSLTGNAITGTGAPLVVNVYGRMGPGQVGAPGSYSDSVSVTLTY